MFRAFIICLFLFYSYSLAGQERAGLVTGNYNGINALSINPAFAFKSPNKWDLQIAGGHLFAQTNYAYITNLNLFSLAAHSDEVSVPETRLDIIPEPSDKIVVFKENGDSFIDGHVKALGLGFMTNLNSDYKVGFSLNYRAIGSSFNLPAIANYFPIQNLVLDSVYVGPITEGAAMAWAEWNLHIGKKINEQIELGATIKLLSGSASGFGKNEADFEFSEFSASNYDILTGGSFTVAFDDNWEDFRINAGYGLGLDAGITFKDYFKEGSILGFSILDIGAIRFNGTSETYGFDTTLVLEGNDYNDIEDLDSLRNQLRSDFTVLESKNGYSMATPGAVSLQYSLPVRDHLSINGYLVQRINYALGNYSTSRSNSLNVTPTYERKFFSAFLPLTLYEYSDLRIGAAVRLGYITIGSDKVMSLFGKRNFSGTDIYVNVQFFPFKLKEKKEAKGKNVQCYW